MGDVDDRLMFVHEYNRIARNHNVRLLKVKDYKLKKATRQTSSAPSSPPPRLPSRRWIIRFFRNVSGHVRNSNAARNENIGHKRSLSDIATQFVATRRDPLPTLELEEIVRICGKALLHLPPRYAPAYLVVPTCVRAIVDYLARNAVNVEGVFRVPGSVRVVTALYDYYFLTDLDGDLIEGTVRGGNLPTHIRFTVHDVASTFKKLLAVLPGGILGSLNVFETFVAISEVRCNPKYLYETKARLIALAVGTVQSHLRRELMCAVFGLLSLLGSAAQDANESDENEDAAQHSTMMNDQALGILFGPLLVGDLISSYTMKLKEPSGGLVLSPATPPLSKQEKRRRSAEAQLQAQALTVEKTWVANQVAAMIIRHWKAAVEYMRGYGVLRPNRAGHAAGRGPDPPRRGVAFRPSFSEPLMAWSQRGWRTQATRPAAPKPAGRQHYMSRGRDRSHLDIRKIRTDTAAGDDLSTRLSTRRSAPILSLGMESRKPGAEAHRRGPTTTRNPHAAERDGRRETRFWTVLFEPTTQEPEGVGDAQESWLEPVVDEGGKGKGRSDPPGPMPGEILPGWNSHCTTNPLAPDTGISLGGMPFEPLSEALDSAAHGRTGNYAVSKKGHVHDSTRVSRMKDYTAYKPSVPSRLRKSESMYVEAKPLREESSKMGESGGDVKTGDRVLADSALTDTLTDTHPQRDSLEDFESIFGTRLEATRMLGEDTYSEISTAPPTPVSSVGRRTVVREMAARFEEAALGPPAERAMPRSRLGDQQRVPGAPASNRSVSCPVGRQRGPGALSQGSSYVDLREAFGGGLDDPFVSEAGGPPTDGQGSERLAGAGTNVPPGGWSVTYGLLFGDLDGERIAEETRPLLESCAGQSDGGAEDGTESHGHLDRVSEER